MHMLFVAVLSSALCYTAVLSIKCDTYCDDEESCGGKFTEVWEKVKGNSKKQWEAADNLDTLEKRGKGGKGKKHKKTENERKQIFKKHIKEANKLNKRAKKTWCAKPNPVLTLDEEEQDKMLHGIKGKDNKFVDTSSKKERPARQRREAMAMNKRGVSIDHRQYTGPVESQPCGNCWTYAASHAVVAIFSRFLGVHMDGSEQQLTWCTYPERTSCYGGQSYDAFDFLMKNRFLAETEYPLDQKSCQTQLLTGLPLVTGWKWGSSHGWGSMDNDNYLDVRITSMKNELYWQPLVVYMLVKSDFYSYGSGTYDLIDSAEAQACRSINHAMLAVGYGNDEDGDYWIIKNSWGTYWGENGYIKVRMGKNLCNVEALAMFPIEY